MSHEPQSSSDTSLSTEVAGGGGDRLAIEQEYIGPQPISGDAGQLLDFEDAIGGSPPSLEPCPDMTLLDMPGETTSKFGLVVVAGLDRVAERYEGGVVDHRAIPTTQKVVVQSKLWSGHKRVVRQGSMSEPKPEFKDRLAQALGASRLSQSELARRVGVSQQLVNALLQGRAGGSKHVVGLARELGVDPDWLATGHSARVQTLMDGIAEMEAHLATVPPAEARGLSAKLKNWRSELSQALTKQGTILVDPAEERRGHPEVSSTQKQPHSSSSIDLNDADMPRSLPVLGTAWAGGREEFVLSGEVLHFAPRPPMLLGRRDIFAVYVDGVSMAPWRQPGDLAHIDPSRPARPGDHVLVELKPQGHGTEHGALLKRLEKINSEFVVLAQYNPPRNDIRIDRTEIAKISRVLEINDLLG